VCAITFPVFGTFSSHVSYDIFPQIALIFTFSVDISLLFPFDF